MTDELSQLQGNTYMPPIELVFAEELKSRSVKTVRPDVRDHNHEMKLEVVYKITQ